MDFFTNGAVFRRRNKYPTLDRVDHVLTCMRLAGGQTLDNLYASSCEIDVMSGTVSFEDFTEARTYEIYGRMPGEKCGLFRDSELGDESKKKLEIARKNAKKRCFISISGKSTGVESKHDK